MNKNIIDDIICFVWLLILFIMLSCHKRPVYAEDFNLNFDSFDIPDLEITTSDVSESNKLFEADMHIKMLEINNLYISDEVFEVDSRNLKNKYIEELETLKQNLFGPKLYFKLDRLLSPITFTGYQLKQLDDLVKQNNGVITDEIMNEYIYYYKEASNDLVKKH